MHKRRFTWNKGKVLLSSPLVVLGCLFLLLWGERIRGRISLGQYRKALAAKGEKLTAADLRLAAPDGDNGAFGVLQAAARLKNGSVLPDNAPPRMKITPEGEAIVCSREPVLRGYNVTNDWSDLAKDLEANKPQLDEIRAALQKPVLVNRLNYEGGPTMKIDHLPVAKTLSYWFGGGCQLALHEDRKAEALDYLTAQIQLPRLLAEDRILISELVRLALAAIARSDTWEALRAEGWTDDDLARIQKAWESQEFLTGMLRSLEGEQVFASVAFNMARKSNDDAVAQLFAMEQFLGADDESRPAWERTLRSLPAGESTAEFLKKQVYSRFWRFAWVDQAERRYLEEVQDLLGIGRQATKDKSWTKASTEVDRFVEGNLDRNFYDRLRFPDPYAIASLAHAINKAMRAETERSLVICAVALHRYKLRFGSFPPTLEALVPDYLEAVPSDYMDGEPLKYRPISEEEFLLYSVGENGTDEGGQSALSDGQSGLQNLWERKDFVWPKAAALKSP